MEGIKRVCKWSFLQPFLFLLNKHFFFLMQILFSVLHNYNLRNLEIKALPTKLYGLWEKNRKIEKLRHMSLILCRETFEVHLMLNKFLRFLVAGNEAWEYALHFSFHLWLDFFLCVVCVEIWVVIVYIVT